MPFLIPLWFCSSNLSFVIRQNHFIAGLKLLGYVSGISIEISSDFKLNYDAGKFCIKGYERASVGLWLQLELCGGRSSMETLKLHRCMRIFST